MKRLLIVLLATALSTPAIAQHSGHHMPGMPMPAAKPKPVLKKAPSRASVKAKKPPVKKTPPKRAEKPAAKRPIPADPHAGHHMPESPAADPHAAHQMPAADPHASHDMGPAPAREADPHAGHHMEAEKMPSPPVAPPPPGAPTGPAHAADPVYGTVEMAAARAEMHKEHGDITSYKLLIDRLEARSGDGRDGYRWDVQAWGGGDIDKFMLKTEGEGAFGRKMESAEVQALWSHAIDPWFDLQLGLRHDVRPDPARTHLVLGVQGLAPYWFEIDAAAFLSNKGDVTARFEAEYDQRITQKLILQPRIEIDLAAQDIAELGIGSGLSTAEAGLRLRYEFVPEFAPYVGVDYERAFGDTADFRRVAGDKAGGWNLLFGIRAWF